MAYGQRITRRAIVAGSVAASAAVTNDVIGRPAASEGARRLMADIARFLEKCPEGFVPTVEFKRGLWYYTADDIVGQEPKDRVHILKAEDAGAFLAQAPL